MVKHALNDNFHDRTGSQGGRARASIKLRPQPEFPGVVLVEFSAVALALALSLLSGCQLPSAAKGTGGVNGDATTSGRNEDAATSCPLGVVAQLGDPTYQSSQIALTALDGAVLSASFVSTASAQTDGLAFALSGDTALPTTAPNSGRIVIIDRYGTNVITWLNVADAKAQAQLPVGTGFESNPQDYLELDDHRALVSRWGINGNPNQQPFDSGSDALVIDTLVPKIVSSIALPSHDNLPPRPTSFTWVGTSVAVILQRMSEDFSTYGDGEIVRIDPNSLQIVQDLTLAGVSNCGRLVPLPDQSGFGLACTGPLDGNGSAADVSRSALVLLDVDSSGQLVERSRINAADLTNEPLQADCDFASASLALVKTQTPLGGSTNNRLIAVDLSSKATEVLAEAHPGADGTGQGITYGSLLCAPGCSSLCLLADADVGVIRRFDTTARPFTEKPPINVTPSIGLLPRQLSHFADKP
jgi:hypothetical protein